MRFADPLLLLLLLLPAAWAVARWRRRREPPREHIAFPMLALLAEEPRLWRERWRWLPAVAGVLGAALLVLALARPQVTSRMEDIHIRSRNLMLVLDVSSSMKSGDFQPGNRIMVGRRVLSDFVRRRDGDLMGLVVFAGRAFLQAPLTPDVDLVEQLLGQVDIGMLPDGTAIGTALALALAQLKDLPPKASTIVLVTDGANNTGKPSPLEAAEAARALGIRIHTVGLSTADTSSVALNGVWRVGNTAARLTRQDEIILTRIAERTGGRFFRATDPEALERIMGEIDPLERTDVTIGETREYRELFAFFLAPGLLLLGLELGLGAGWLRTVP
ncbi:MAG TPA: VWA domain-containing protein [Gemmatimonadales bacterium]|jgi:Ca-activated chloride channel family protein|nr:VWA domain-containing protein [Gemmatimonadales bacterium]